MQRFLTVAARGVPEYGPMPDYQLMGMALCVSAGIAALLLLIAAWPWRTPHPLRLRVGWVLGLGAGFYAGCAVLGQQPRWPIPEDRDRFLVVLVPLTLAVEIAAAAAPGPRWLAWLLRLCLAGAAAPILLFNSVYLADLAGPDSAEWTPIQAAAILFGLGAALATVWGLLALLQARTLDRAASPVLVLSFLAAGVTVMLSGYFKGGLLALPFAGALIGGTLASFVAPAPPSASRCLGVGVVGLFGILLIGRFFGSLPTSAALCLGFAPVLAWVSEVPGVRKLRPSLRAAARLVLVAAPLVFVVVNAQMKFAEASVTGSRPYEPSFDDFKP
jgi:hypothetical protein